MRTIVNWIHDEDIPADATLISGLGGWVDGQTWGEYTKGLPNKEWFPYLNAFKNYIREYQLREGGFWHQDYEGTPVFDDGTIISVSFRSWGDMMAAAWNTIEHTRRYSYTDFAWTSCPPFKEWSPWKERLAFRKSIPVFNHHHKQYRLPKKKTHKVKLHRPRSSYASLCFPQSRLRKED